MLGPEFFQQVVLAVLIGALLGLEREYHKKQEVVGVRTFALISMLGAICAIVSEKLLLDYTLTFIGFIFVSAFAVILYINGLLRKRAMGFTTNISIMMVYVFGVLAGFGFYEEAIFLSILVAVILFSKEKLHHFVEKLTQREIADLLEFLVILGIFYPIIPQEIVVSGVAIPIFLMWSLIVLVSVINFIAFIIARFLSIPHKIEMISFFGGLAATTATVGALASIYKQNKKLIYNVSAGITVASAALYLRNFAILLIAAPYLYMYLGPPLLFAIVPLLIATYFLAKHEKKHATLRIKSPFNVAFAVKLGVGVLILSIALNIAQDWGNNFFIVAAFFGGMISTLVTTPSIAGVLAEGMITPELAIGALVIMQIGGIVQNMIILNMGSGAPIVRKTALPIIVAAALSVVGMFVGFYLF